MRENWNKSSEDLPLSKPDIEELLKPLFGRCTVEDFHYTKGGLANTNLCVKLYNRLHPVLLRLFVRDPSQSCKEVAIYRVLYGKTPVPELLHFEETNTVTGHPYSVMEWIEGERLESAAKRFDCDDIKQIALSLGAAMAAIHSNKFAQAGFLDSKLQVSMPISIGADGLKAYAEECLNEKGAENTLGPELTARLMRYIEDDCRLIDECVQPPCLTHSDFGCSNILVARGPSGWTVRAVLDWEFAFSGSPFFDFGNLLRPPFGETPGLEMALAAAYRAHGGSLPERWREVSRMTDLSAWLDFLTRPNVGDNLLRDARRIIAETINQEKLNPTVGI